MTQDEVTVKCDALAAGIIGQKQCAESAKLIMATEHARGVSRLIFSWLK